MWDWLFGTRHVWIELKSIGQLELIKRPLHINPFGGIFVYYYTAIERGRIMLFINGQGKSDTPYLEEILRWTPTGNRPLRRKYQEALALGTISKPWAGDR